jgi:hypothetical protein
MDTVLPLALPCMPVLIHRLLFVFNEKYVLKRFSFFDNEAMPLKHLGVRYNARLET